jgi:polygalacturonase
MSLARRPGPWLLAGALALTTSGATSAQETAARVAGPSEAPWTRLPEVLARITPPVFPDRQCRVEGSGCRADGVSDCTVAFRKAVESCHRAGGGHVVAPKGEALTGAIHLLSNVNLHVPAGSTLRFSRDPSRYLPVVFTRWEGVELMNYSPLIYAFEAENVAVTGGGALDGQADEEHWWPWKGGRTGPDQKADRARLLAQAERGTTCGRPSSSSTAAAMSSSTASRSAGRRSG